MDTPSLVGTSHSDIFAANSAKKVTNLLKTSEFASYVGNSLTKMIDFLSGFSLSKARHL
jgi:hypothetical protein